MRLGRGDAANVAAKIGGLLRCVATAGTAAQLNFPLSDKEESWLTMNRICPNGHRTG